MEMVTKNFPGEWATPNHPKNSQAARFGGRACVNEYTTFRSQLPTIVS